MTHRRAPVCALLTVFALQAGTAFAEPAGRNHLGTEKSPYLLEHASNPVWWWTWTPEALAEAKRQDKPIFLSIGYSTCHWCHVMARESFEDPEVARQLNDHFIAIKVDREERPDLDAIYMRAVESMTGRGGWPMTTILTPEGRPFFGGTYFPRARLLQALAEITTAWKADRARIEQTGVDLSQTLASAPPPATQSLSGAQLIEFARRAQGSFDSANGGTLGAPKFPHGSALQLLLRIDWRRPDPALRAEVTKTLDAMARGGIDDQIGGGFHRYSTDAHWLVPHFEKMLYDQASLTNAYLDAYAVTGNPEYALVARETLDYVLRDMTDPGGGFYSAEDADSEGAEGKFYLWSETELRSLLSPTELTAVQRAFDVTAAGNFQGANILHLVEGDRAHRPVELTGALAKMASSRSRRVRPRRDEKVITSWNGLMIGALAHAARRLNEPRYAAAAARAARFVLSHNRAADGALLRRWRAGDARYRGTLSDYADLIDALIELYETDFDPTWLREAVVLQRQQEKNFAAPDGGYYLTDGTDASLIRRLESLEDNVEPAGTSVSARNLLRLSELFLDDAYEERAARLFTAAAGLAQENPDSFPVLLSALDDALEGGREVAIVGRLQDSATGRLLAAVRAGYHPGLVVVAGLAGTKDVPLLRGKTALHGRPTAYVCEKRSCKLPTTDPAAVARSLQSPVP